MDGIIMDGILEIAIAYICCTLILIASRYYTETYCKDNDPIIWIWLDDDEPQGGHPVRIITRSGCRKKTYRTSLAGVPAI